MEITLMAVSCSPSMIIFNSPLNFWTSLRSQWKLIPMVTSFSSKKACAFCGGMKDNSYKLARAGKKLVRIDKWYPSSKICSCCGKLKKELKLEDRIYSCTCGNQMNRDKNAAINICREGLRISGVELDTERKIS